MKVAKMDHLYFFCLLPDSAANLFQCPEYGANLKLNLPLGFCELLRPAPAAPSSPPNASKYTRPRSLLKYLQTAKTAVKFQLGQMVLFIGYLIFIFNEKDQSCSPILHTMES